MSGVVCLVLFFFLPRDFTTNLEKTDVAIKCGGNPYVLYKTEHPWSDQSKCVVALLTVFQNFLPRSVFH